MDNADRDRLARILDYHLGLDDPATREEIARQLTQDPRMQHLHAWVQAMMEPLAAWSEEEPSADLTHRTWQRIQATRGLMPGQEVAVGPVGTGDSGGAGVDQEAVSLAGAGGNGLPRPGETAASKPGEAAGHGPGARLDRTREAWAAATRKVAQDMPPGARERRPSERQPRAGGRAPRRGESRIAWLGGNLRDLIVAAACVLLMFSAFRPAATHMRHMAQQDACAMQLKQVYAGLSAYAQDYAGSFPFVSRPAGAKWWNVGGDPQDSGSNTRNLYLLVKGGYVPLERFVCPSCQDPRARRVRMQVHVPAEVLAAMHDFADRGHVTYSLRLVNGRRLGLDGMAGQALMADVNPLFADFEPKNCAQLDLRQNESLWQTNSPNHGGRGQNVLMGDGAVIFATERWIGPGQDDIFTIQNQAVYEGVEMPSDDSDAFIAP